MKPESKKNRGKAGASSVVDAQNNVVESCYDLSNLSNALSMIAAPAVVNPTESSSTRKDGGSSPSAYDFVDFATELSTIEHKEKKLAALRSRSHRKRGFLRMRHVFLDAIMGPSVTFRPVSLVPVDAALRPSRHLRNHPLVDFPLTSVDWMTGGVHGGFSELRAEQPVVEEMKEDGLNPTTTAGPTPELEERPFPIMYRLSRIVSLGSSSRRRHCRVVL